MAAKQGFLMYYSKGDAIGTKVSVRYRRSGRLSGVVVKRGSTVIHVIDPHEKRFGPQINYTDNIIYLRIYNLSMPGRISDRESGTEVKLLPFRPKFSRRIIFAFFEDWSGTAKIRRSEFFFFQYRA